MLWFHFPHEDNVKKMYFNQFISCEISIKSSQCKESGLVIYCGEFFIGCVLVDNLIILMSDERPYWVAWQVLNMRYCSPWSIIITTSIYECWTMLQTTHQTLSTPNIIVQLTTSRNEIIPIKIRTKITHLTRFLDFLLIYYPNDTKHHNFICDLTTLVEILDCFLGFQCMKVIFSFNDWNLTKPSFYCCSFYL